MSRAARTLLIVVGLGLAGLLALTWMARRYANLQPRQSVADAVRAAQPPAPAPPPEPAAPEPAPPPEPGGPREADLRDVDRFLAVRAALRKVVDAQPGAARQLASQLSEGDAAQLKPLQFNLVFLTRFRLAREEAIQKAGWTFEGYRGVRAEFESWRGGAPPADAARAAAFEARRPALEKAWLGDLEKLDRVADVGLAD